MRDLSKYPVTQTEIIDYLQDLAMGFMSEEICGDMRPLLLFTARAIILQQVAHESELKKLLAHARSSDQDVPDHIVSALAQMVDAPLSLC